MSCFPTINFLLYKESKVAMERIKKQQNLDRLFGAAISSGVFNSVFTKNQ